MKIGDQIKIILEIAPYCSCVSYGRGDERMTCARHGLPELRKKPEIRNISGIIQGFCEPTTFSPRTVLVDLASVGLTLPSAQFTFGGDLFMCEGKIDDNILSMYLDEKSRQDLIRADPEDKVRYDIYKIFSCSRNEKCDELKFSGPYSLHGAEEVLAWCYKAHHRDYDNGYCQDCPLKYEIRKVENK